MAIAKVTELYVKEAEVQPTNRLSVLCVKLAFILLFALLSPVYYLNKRDFKRHKRKNPFCTSKLVQLQGRFPLLYEIAMYVQNFPIPRNVYKVMPELKGDVLQVGCGTGLLNKYARRNKQIKWINMDPNLNALRLGVKLGRYNDYVHAYIDKPTPLKNDCCDMIVFARSFHHIRNHKKAFKECSRLLRNGGTVIIADPVVLEEKGGGHAGKGYMANSSIDGVIWRFTRETFVRHLRDCLPEELEMESVTDSRQLHVTNYNLFVPQTDLIAVLRKKGGLTDA